MSEFTCFKCKKTFLKKKDKTWNEFKAAKEMLDLYPECKNSPTDILCSPCNEEFKKWFATISDEEKKNMREIFYAEQKTLKSNLMEN